MTDLLLTSVRTNERTSSSPVDAVGRASSHPLAGRGLVVKRVIDVVVSLIGLLLVAPFVALVLLAVRLESRGPVFFKQERVGRDHRTFRMYKIRSMRADADHPEHRIHFHRHDPTPSDPHNFQMKLAGDSRVTRVGRFIRKTSIDEIPQLWNVIRGDMSLVGPRPALPHEVALYDDVARRRLAVDPGVTGPWQVSGRCNVTFKEMIEMDLAYARDWTPLRDLAIIARTPIVALTGKGAA